MWHIAADSECPLSRQVLEPKRTSHQDRESDVHDPRRTPRCSVAAGSRPASPSSAIPEEDGSWWCCLAIDENVGGAIRSEICELDIIFISLIWLLHGTPRCIFSFIHAGNPASFHLAVRLVHVDIATNRRRVRHASLYREEGIDLHEIVEGAGGHLVGSVRRPIGHPACFCAKPIAEIVRELKFLRQRAKSVRVKVAGTHMLRNCILMILPYGEP